MLMMERLYPLDFRAHEVEVREIWADVFTTGFINLDLLRPSNIPGDRYDNIFLTANCLRLVDVGISALRRQVGESFFAAYVRREEEAFAVFRAFFSSR